MEVSLSPGKTAFIINIITDALALIASFSLISILNAYGRWKLHQKGKVSMDMHFHNMSFGGAFLSLVRLRQSSARVVILLIIQTIILAFLRTLMSLAPIGISESKNLSVHRYHTIPGEALCYREGLYNSEMIGMATERVIKHFNAGGKVISVGKTGRNHDAILLENERSSLGHAVVVDKWDMEARINVSDGNISTFTLNLTQFLRNTTGYLHSVYSNDFFLTHSVVPMNTTPLPNNGAIVDGPFYVIVCTHNPLVNENKMEKCAFSRCAVPHVELQPGEVVSVRGNCSVATIERQAFKAGAFRSYYGSASPLKYLDISFKGLDVSELGKRSQMVGDLAFILRSRPCGDTYVAYLPPSEVSWVSIAIICSLGTISLVVSVVAIMSFSITRNTFN
ncbi:hypothetical protein BWQ96_02820 [Gracilariopsis chorda]|uniref:Uncharacterized protein n=1 Tax=Gracilariopsis chorda TaxID=448386 RepID=A0A2V3J1R8_9FLOR|nr:hypothetical protein BWQ96_02820 [Gracilariopsis chorda]|eukprot:PXF47340.1 hypothetical protein BWQ96_02820 [Gracilariopsis chorda]